MNYPKTAWLTVLCCMACLGASAQTERRRGPVIRQVDHILIESNNPRDLFGCFADTLQLPIAWPITDYQGFTSGGLGTGSVNLELFSYADRKDASARKISRARYVGLAFEPHPLVKALPELEVRQIPYSPPEPHSSKLPDGSQGVAWTTVALPSFSKPGMSITLYEYNPLFLKVDVRRRQSGNRLELNRGGPLGIQSVSEITIGAANIEKAKIEYERLLGAPSPAGIWRVGDGPAIRLVQDAEDRIQRMVFKVESLSRAIAFLRKSGLAGSVSDKEASLNPSRVQGLKILLVGR